MKWNLHLDDVPPGAHSILSPSQNSWLNYDDDKMYEAYKRRYAQAIGTLSHEYAARYIRWGQRAKAGDKTGLHLYLLDHKIPAVALDTERIFKTWLPYVNDSVKHRMRPEQPLKYSEFAFGTADAISFSERNRELKIFDLKTGEGKASMDQLYIYAALFCMEYDYSPGEIDIFTRIYQFGDFVEDNPTASDILPIMDDIRHKNDLLVGYKEESRYEPS